MDDMFSSMTDVRLTPEQARIIVETMEADMDQNESYQTESFVGLINRIKENILDEEITEDNELELDANESPEKILKRIQDDMS